MMFVPRRGGAVSAVPVSTGAVVAGLPEARAKLEADRATAVASVDEGSRAALKRRNAVGRIRAVGPSDACTAQDRLIRVSSDFHIVTCAAELYRFKPRHGTPFEVVDLALTTDDDDAVRNLPIPFGLFDSLEIGIGAPSGVVGTLTYDVVASGGRAQINIIRSFVRGR